MSFAVSAAEVPEPRRSAEEILAERGWVVSDPITSIEQVEAFRKASKTEREAVAARRGAELAAQLKSAGFSLSQPITTETLDDYLNGIASEFHDESDLGISH